VIVSLGRPQAMGERRRVASWRSLFAAIGAEVDEVALLDGCRRRLPAPRPGDLRALADGTMVPEALAWSPRALNRRLADLDPDLVVCVSARSYHPDLRARSFVLDYVDRLSVSYRDRAGASRRLRGRVGYRLVSVAAGRFERHPLPSTTYPVAAGLADAVALGAKFVPVLFEGAAPPAGLRPDRDVLFMGTLTYAPNIAAVERLGRWWPEVQRRRPGTTALVAGASPGPGVRRLAEEHGWELLADFDEVADVCRRARVAVAPLPFASGIQGKVVDAAVHGLAQVVSPAAVAGLPPGLPGVVAADDAFVDELVALLEDDGRRQALGRAAQDWAVRQFSVAAWAPWAETLLAAAIRR